MGRVWLLWGCIFGFMAVGLGAFATHGLEKTLDPEMLKTLDTANRYLAYHAFALLAFGLWSHWEKWSSGLWTGLFFVLGIILFSGSLYIYVLMGLHWAVFITPVGGTFFLIGWISFALSIFRTRSSII